MIYCSVDEAFNKNLTDMYSKNPHRNEQFFNSQGDLENSQHNTYDMSQMNGTTIKQLKDNSSLASLETSFAPSINDISYDDMSRGKPATTTEYKMHNRPEPRTNSSTQMKHEYCIKRFVDSIIYNDDVRTVDSSDDEIYNHIKDCKYCKTQINTKMKHYYIAKTEPKIQEHFDEGSGEYSIKEIMIIVIIGILLIFVIDLLVKLGKKM